MLLNKRNLKRIFIIVLAFICSFLFVSCSATDDSNKELADNIISSVQDSMNKTNNENEEILIVSGQPITKEEFVCYCRFNSVILDTTYDCEETIYETIRSYALVQEAKLRGITLTHNENNEIETLSQECNDCVNESYFPLQSFKDISEMSYLESELFSQIRKEICLGEISINDKNTRKLHKKFKSFSHKLEKLIEYLSNEHRLEGLKKFLNLYNDVEKSYINYLIVTHLSLPKVTSNSTTNAYTNLDYFDKVFENISDAKNPRVLATVNGEQITEVDQNMYRAMGDKFTYTTEELVRIFILSDYAKSQGLPTIPIGHEKIIQLDDSLIYSDELTDEYCMQKYGISKDDVSGYRISIGYQMWYYHAFLDMLINQISSEDYPQHYPELLRSFEKYKETKLRNPCELEELERTYYERLLNDYDVVIYE